jgi:hypothetical protein
MTGISDLGIRISNLFCPGVTLPAAGEYANSHSAIPSSLSMIPPATPRL